MYSSTFSLLTDGSQVSRSYHVAWAPTMNHFAAFDSFYWWNDYYSTIRGICNNYTTRYIYNYECVHVGFFPMEIFVIKVICIVLSDNNWKCKQLQIHLKKFQLLNKMIVYYAHHSFITLFFNFIIIITVICYFILLHFNKFAY